MVILYFYKCIDMYIFYKFFIIFLSELTHLFFYNMKSSGL